MDERGGALTLPAMSTPQVVWSHTRERTHQQCERLYHLRYAPPSERRRGPTGDASLPIYALKHLTTLDLAFGSEIHNRAREVAACVLDRRCRPTGQVLARPTRAALGRLWRRGRRDAFLADPRNYRMLASAFYGEPDPAAVQRIREKLAPCHDNLVMATVWDDVSAVGSGGVLLLDAVVQFPFAGATVYAAPDILYRSPEGRSVVEWKTGSAWGVMDQVSIYGLYLREVLHVTSDPICHARVIDLRTGTDTRSELTQADIDSAAARIRAGVGQLPVTTLALPRPDPSRPGLCRTCTMRGACFPTPSPSPSGAAVPSLLPVTNREPHSGTDEACNPIQDQPHSMC